MYRASLAPHLRVARVSTGSGDASPGRASSRRRSPKRGASLVRAASSSPSTAPRPASPEDWDALAPVAFASPIADALAADELLVLGTKRALLSDALARALGADDALRDAIRSVARDAAPGDAGSKRTVLLPAAAEENTSAEDTSAEDPSSLAFAFREVTVATLPSTSRLSRHNCPANARAAFAQLQSVPHPKDGKTLGVVTALEDPAHAVPLAAAVARAFPTYTAKSAEGRDTAEGRGRVARKGVVACASVVVAEEASDNNSAVNASEANASSITSSSGPSSSNAVIASLVGSGVRLAARIVDAPPAEMDPDALVAEALRVAASARELNGADVVADVKRFAALEAEGFGGICAVGRCAARDGREPALVHLKLAVPAAAGGEKSARKKKVAVVGKGITFDTGGLQIKPRTGMPGMKSDLGGAAAALAAFGALCALPESAWSGSTVSEVHLLLCVAENAIGSGAFRPDDVVTHRSGRTSEINNTDAEGRLVLADGVAYASQPARLGGLACDDVIDIATLTGAQMVATGRHFAGVVSDSEAMERACVDAGRASGDLTHALPYAPEFFAGEFASKIADAKNSVKDRSNAQASCAGQFIAEHLWRGGRGAAKGKKGNGGAEPEGEEGDRRGERRWLHVDVAGPSVAAGSGRGTGFGVALLVELIAGRGLYRS